MKRSEMLEIINKAMQSAEIVDASHVLAEIEKAGMQAPPYQEYRGSGYSDEYGNEELYIDWVQGWEQE